MSIHVIAHGGCTDTVRESALEVDSGTNIPSRTVDSNPHQFCAWLFSQTLCRLTYSCLVMQQLLPDVIEGR